MRHVRITVGLVAWAMGIACFVVWIKGYLFDQRAGGRRVATDLWEFASAERRFVRLDMEGTWPLAVGDPIYRVDGPDSIQQVGEIRRVVPRDSFDPSDTTAGPLFEALLYPNAPHVGRDSYMKYYTTPRSLTWVMETMLPPEKQARIAREIVATYETYRGEIVDAIRPVVTAGLFDALSVAEDDLAKAVARRRGELTKLGERYQDDVVQQEIIPLVRKEIWPIVQRHAEPLANEIGQEMFARASLWRFGWRALYDKSFLPQKNLTQSEWHRFVNEEGVPVLERHQQDIIAVQRKVLEQIARNQKVREALRHNLERVADDPEFRAIVWQIFRESVVDNPRLRKKLEQRWRSAEARQAVQLAADYVEPCVRRIGDLLFGTREAGIAPEFAQVLRNQILDKDCRWLVIMSPADAAPLESLAKHSVLPVRHGGYPDVNPFAVQLQETVR